MCILVAGGMARLNRGIPCLKLTVKGTPEHRPFYQRKVVSQLSFFLGGQAVIFYGVYLLFVCVWGGNTSTPLDAWESFLRSKLIP